MLLGSLEARDKNLTCAVGDGHGKILDKIEVPRTMPQKSFKEVITYFRHFTNLKALGISSFGPIELRSYSPKYGYITDTSRKGWKNTNVVGTMKHYLNNIPMSWTTDVNSSAYGEYIHSVLDNHPIRSLAYVTIGKGVGVGIVNQGQFIGDQGNPEIGHIIPKRNPKDMTFKGVCPYQGDCLEGLVSSKAFEARFHKSFKEISMFCPIWDIVAYYIAQCAVQATLFIRPQQIIFGGAIMNPIELRKIKVQFKKLLNNYVPVGNLDKYIQMPDLSSSKLAIIGNLSLAKKHYYAESPI